MSSRDSETELSTDRWQTLQRLFEQALEMSTEARDHFLSQAGRDDPGLEQELRSLLRHHRENLPEPPRREAPAGLGPYRVVRELGRGGMGEVFLAERADGEYRGRVAIKILRREMAGDEARRRFLLERQLLADFDHPNIASMKDAGTTGDGRPFLVMDHVEGRPIDVYCRDERLSLRDRLKLFRTVCSAVHVAHQGLVVHRDLKPGNILVRAGGSPVLLDFGVAKLLDEKRAADSDLTRFGSAPRTPAYASPEQIEGRPITTATDIWALGVILFELLTGERPFAGRGQALEERIRRAAPSLPSEALRTRHRTRDQPGEPIIDRQLRGDVDGIVLKALAREPSQRYRSAAELADDLENFLAGRAVRARRGSGIYHALKLVRRNKVPVATGLAFAVLLGAFLASTAFQSRRLAREAGKVQAMNAFLQETLETPDPFQGMGRGVTVAEAVSAAAGRIDESFAGQPELAASAKHTLGTIFIHLGDYWGAEPLIVEALETRRRLSPEPGVELAESVNRLAQLRVRLGRHDEAEPLIAEALELLGRLPEPEPRHLADSLRERAVLKHFDGDLEAARDLYQRILDLRRETLGPENPEVATGLADLASVARDQGAFDEAEKLLRAALELRRWNLGAEHPTVAQTLGDLGSLAVARGDLDGAEAFSQEALKLARGALGEGHPEVAVLLHQLGDVRIGRSDYAQASEYFQQALELRRSALGERHPVVAESLASLGFMLAERGELEAAEGALEEALAIHEASLGPAHVVTAETLLDMGEVKAAAGRHGEALADYQRAYEIFREHFGEEHPKVALSLNNVAVAHYYLGDARRGIAALREVLRIKTDLYGPKHPDVGTAQINLGQVLADGGSYGEAEELYLEALETLREVQGWESPRVADVLDALGGLYDDTGRPEKARDAFRRALEIQRKVLGPRHRRVAMVLNNLAMLEFASGRSDPAETALRESLDVLKDHPGHDSVLRSRALKNLAEVVCEQAGRETEALDLYRRAFDAARGDVDPEHWIWSVYRSAYGACLARAGDAAEASALLESSLAELASKLGEDHLQTNKAARRLEAFRAAETIDEAASRTGGS